KKNGKLLSDLYVVPRAIADRSTAVSFTERASPAEFSIMAETAENNVANTLVKDSNIQRPSDDITSTMFTISEEVNNCYEGKCHACFMLWMFKGCIYLQKNPDGISVTIEFVGKSIFSKIIQDLNNVYNWNG
ncbi:hypothetical protein MAR_012105, partial [Mya arenaria]